MSAILKQPGQLAYLAVLAVNVSVILYIMFRKDDRK